MVAVITRVWNNRYFERLLERVVHLLSLCVQLEGFHKQQLNVKMFRLACRLA